MQCNWTQALFTFTISEKNDRKSQSVFKNRIESFDDYYPCIQKDECNLFHVYNWIQFFVSMYNDTTSTNNNYFVNQLQEEVVNLT
jgi:hypothetical protein